MGLNAAARARLIEQIEASTTAGPQRDALLFRALLGRTRIPSRRVFQESFFRFEDKATLEWGPMTLNIPQRLQEAYAVRCIREGEPQRDVTLKARQFGISTKKLADGLEEVTRGSHVNALIIGDVDETSQTLLQKGKTMIEMLPYELPRFRDNRRQLAFGPPINGSVAIQTAKGLNPGRGKTYKFIHGTEPAFWDDPVKKIRSLNNAVPTRPGTVLSYESTANGYNWFHDFWWDAENGKNTYKAFFFPWYIDPTFDYYMEPTPEEALAILDTLDEEEEWLIGQGVVVGQLKWRRYAIASVCFNDIDSFHQEYPAQPQEAFLASGRPAFSGKMIQAAIRRWTTEPEETCDLLVGEPERERLSYRVVGNPDGCLRIWKRPEDGMQYMISADVAEGLDTGDFSAAHIGEMETGEQVAEWHGHESPKEFGRILACLGWLYNHAWVVPETNNHGISTLDGLRDAEYPRIMRRHVFDSATSPITNKLGWHTGPATRPLLLNEIRSHLAAGPEGAPFRSYQLGLELLQMEVDDAGKAQAPRGKFDDRVFALGIFLAARAKAWAKGVVETPEPEKPSNYYDPHWVHYRRELEESEARNQ